MSTWEIRWNFSLGTYQPGNTGLISFYLENFGNTPLFLSEVGIQFDWMGEKYYQKKVSDNLGNIIPPNSTRFISNVSFDIPQAITGQRFYTIIYHIYEKIPNTNIWNDLGNRESNEKYFINVFPSPFYNAFITRSIRPEDRIIGDEIVKIIKEWGFNANTVDFPERISDEQLRNAIRDEIKKSDCLIAIASPRYVDALSGVWRTFPYLHSELGIAFGQDYPLLILSDNRVALDGLPANLRENVFEFEAANYENIRNNICPIMPAFRNWISNKKQQEFLNTLGKIAVGAGLVALGGIAASLLASSKK
ncbi:MAG: hypothetical protein KAW45_02605 [Thermoplasmatales archaeon]|nr:hypothetical protein [Thermoplasmatales archaeon]